MQTLRRLICTTMLALMAAVPAASAQCRHALVLALDISGSVNQEEYLLQIHGLAQALADPEVRDLILANPEAPIALSIFEWADPGDHTIVQDWIEIQNAAMLDNLVAHLWAYRAKRSTIQTGIGDALRLARGLFDRGPNCARRTIDISGDGQNNRGPSPQEVYASGQFDGITVNALVVSPADDERRQASVYFQRQTLLDYFEDEVIHGPFAFSELAFGYADFARAMKVKLIKELSPLQLARWKE